MSNPSVLVFCPVHPEKGLHPRTQAILDGLTYPVFDLWVTRGDNPYSHTSPLTASRLNVLHQYEKAQTLMRRGAYDYLLTLESDMLPPVDVIERLLTTGADVAYALYCFRASRKWSAFTQYQLGQGVSLSADPEQARAVWGQVLDVSGLGLGATLIRREVLEAVEFHGYMGTACDGYFALDVQKKGFVQRCDTGCLAGHVEGGVVLWPDPDAPGLCREEVL